MKGMKSVTLRFINLYFQIYFIRVHFLSLLWIINSQGTDTSIIKCALALWSQTLAEIFIMSSLIAFCLSPQRWCVLVPPWRTTRTTSRRTGWRPDVHTGEPPARCGTPWPQNRTKPRRASEGLRLHFGISLSAPRPDAPVQKNPRSKKRACWCCRGCDQVLWLRQTEKVTEGGLRLLFAVKM